MNDKADIILEEFFSDPELQRLKRRAQEERKRSKYRCTRADADYDRYLIRKSFFLSGYKQDMIQKSLERK